MPVRYFVLVYDRSAGKLIEDLRTYDEADVAAAQRDRFTRELAYRDRPNIETVILGGDSEYDLLRTHARYFCTLAELAAGLPS